MRYAIVIDGKVDNIIEWDGKSEYKPDTGELFKLNDVPASEGQEEKISPVGIGWTLQDGKFIAPPSKASE